MENFRSFVPEIKTQEEITKYLVYNEKNIQDIPATEHEPWNPQFKKNLFNISSEIGIVDRVYKCIFHLGSFEKGNHVVASQIAFVFRVTNPHQWQPIFVETVCSQDLTIINDKESYSERYKGGYKFFTNNANLFLSAIQTPDFEEHQEISNMILKDYYHSLGIATPCIIIPSRLKIQTLEILTEENLTNEKLNLILKYMIFHQYTNIFNYFYHALKWESTSNYIIYEECLKKMKRRVLYKHFPHLEISLPNKFVSLVPQIENPDQIKLFFNYFLKFNSSRILLDDENDDTIFSSEEFNVDSVDQLFHIRWLENFRIFSIRDETKISSYQCEISGRLVGNLYFEMICFDIYYFDEIFDSIMVVTRNPYVFSKLIQLGNRKEISEFILQDQNHYHKRPEDNTLKQICLRALFNLSIGDNEKEIDDLPIPETLKIDIRRCPIMMKRWKKMITDDLECFHSSLQNDNSIKSLAIT